MSKTSEKGNREKHPQNKILPQTWQICASGVWTPVYASVAQNAASLPAKSGWDKLYL